MHESSQTDKDRGAKKTPDLIQNALTNKLEQQSGRILSFWKRTTCNPNYTIPGYTVDIYS